MSSTPTTPQFPIPADPNNSVVQSSPGAQDIRTYLAQFQNSDDPQTRDLGSCLQTLQEYSDSIAQVINDIISYLNQLASQASGGGPTGFTTAIDIPQGPHITQFPASIIRVLGEKLGEVPSVMDFGAAGDLQQGFDGVTSGGSPNFNSPSAPFTLRDVGKTIVILNVGPAGATLLTTIQSVTDPANIVLSTSASVGLTFVNFAWGTDDHIAFANAIAGTGFGTTNRLTGSLLLIPPGKYLIGTKLNILNRNSFKLIGSGPGTVLFPMPFNDNLFDLSGSTDLELANFMMDGTFLGNVNVSAVFADGNFSFPTYGRIKIHHCFLFNWQPLGFSLNATAGNVVNDISIEDNLFYNCGFGTNTCNTINATGAGGKSHYRINRNAFIYITLPASNPGNAIFCANGICTDFEISSNVITNPPGTGIVVRNRPFGTEATTFKDVVIKGNIVNGAGWNGISNMGTWNIVIADNVIHNPAQLVDASSARRCGILLADQATGAGPTFQSALNVVVNGNDIVDDSSLMQYGILESNGGSTPTTDATGVILGNQIPSFLIADVLILTKLALLRTHGKNWGVNRSSTTFAPFSVEGDVRAETVPIGNPGLFTEMTMLGASSAGGFLIGYGWNIRFDGANWVSGGDGTSNGAALALVDYGAGKLNFYVFPNVGGGGSQIVAPANLHNFLMFQLDIVAGAALINTILNVATINTTTINGLGASILTINGNPLDLNSSAAMTLIATGLLTLQGANVTLTTAGNILMTAASVNINPSGSLNLNPSGSLQFNGINGVTISGGFEITGFSTTTLTSGSDAGTVVVTGITTRAQAFTKGGRTT